MAKTTLKSVDDYLARQPEAAQPMLRQVRRAIRGAVPAAEEVISYQIPAYRLPGGVVLYFAGWKRHYSLYPVGQPLREAFKDELAAYEISKGTIRFPHAGPVPVRLIARIARFRAKEIAARTKRKPRAAKATLAGKAKPRAAKATPAGKARKRAAKVRRTAGRRTR